MTLNEFKGLAADLARPFSIYATSLSAAVVPVIVVARMSPESFELVAAAALVGALYAGVGALYWGKAWENTRVDTATAKASAVAPTPAPGTATITAAPDVDVAVRDATDGGELPASQRVEP